MYWSPQTCAFPKDKQTLLNHFSMFICAPNTCHIYTYIFERKCSFTLGLLTNLSTDFPNFCFVLNSVAVAVLFMPLEVTLASLLSIGYVERLPAAAANPPAPVPGPGRVSFGTNQRAIAPELLIPLDPWIPPIVFRVLRPRILTLSGFLGHSTPRSSSIFSKYYFAGLGGWGGGVT